jgi:uncharacterized delta-60 repeat protein
MIPAGNMALVEAWIERCQEGRPMQQEMTRYQRIVSSVRRLQAVMRRGGGVGMLAGLLLLPLSVGAAGSGDLDVSFGGDGTVLTDFGSGSFAYVTAVAIQADGKIVVAGESNASGSRDFALARYLPNGTLDTTFGGDGTVLTGFGSSCCEGAGALVLQPDSKIVVAGSSYSTASNYDFALARYLPNGTLDTTFGGDGMVLTDFGSGREDIASALALQPDGKLVVAGWSTVSGSFDFALARYLPNGTPDPSFDGDGMVLTDFGSGSWDKATALALQPDGKIVVAGHSIAGVSYDFALARYLPNGTLDPSFGGDGTVTTDFGSGSSDGAAALVLQPDGKIVVAGSSSDSDGGAFALARYRPNGTLDPSFSGDGRVLTDFGGSEDGAATLALQPNSKIVVAGFSNASGTNDFAVARYLPNGTLDATFSGDGKVRTDFGGGSYEVAYALAIQPRDGRLVVAGGSNASGNDGFAVSRYHAITCNGEEESSPMWQNLAMASQTQTFTALFDAVPHQNRMDGVTGLTLSPANGPEDLGVIVRFNPAGFLDARNGSAYQAARSIPYVSGMRYQIRLVVKVPQHTYSVYVTPDGGAEQTLATSYAFRTEQGTVPRLDTWALRSWSGSHTVCNFAVGASSSTAWQHFPVASQAQTFEARFEAVAHQNHMDGVTGLALGPVDAPEDLGVLVRFNPAGFLDARNGSAYQADQSVPYTVGTRYAIRLVVNVAQHTYSVYVTPESGEEQTLATDYAFRTEQGTVPRLDTWALRSWSGSHTVSHVTLE